MDNKERGKELEKRTRRFAVRIIKLASKLPDTEVGKIVKYQVTNPTPEGSRASKAKS